MSESHLIDRMPEVAHRDREWTRAESAHLESCRECAADWQLVEAAVVASSSPPTLNLDRITSGVVAATIPRRPLTIPKPTSPRRWRRYSIVGLAAAAGLLLVLRLTTRQATPPDLATPAVAATVLPELDGLNETELSSLLASMTVEPSADGAIGEIPRLGDLTDEELNQLLTEIGG